MREEELLEIAKPILFNTEMVKAILKGRKTVTRRVVKPSQYMGLEKNIEPKKSVERAIYRYKGITDYDVVNMNFKPPYQVNDILYVRETWHKYIKRVGKGESCRLQEFYGYRASIANSEDAHEPWKPSIHMPKEAARLFLRVTSVKVERLQDMNEVDTAKEGIRPDIQTQSLDNPDFIENWGGLIIFKELWDSTIKKNQIDTYGWNANPYVWVIEFEKIKEVE